MSHYRIALREKSPPATIYRILLVAYWHRHVFNSLVCFTISLGIVYLTVNLVKYTYYFMKDSRFKDGAYMFDRTRGLNINLNENF